MYIPSILFEFFFLLGGYTFFELMQRGVPLNLIDKYMNDAKIVEPEK